MRPPSLKLTIALAGACLAGFTLAAQVRPGQPLSSGDPAADTPPAEYLYLDSQRVLAYLGQIDDGLSGSEKRTATNASSINASLSAGQVATAGATSEQRLSSERVFTETEADRFYRLLRKLRNGGPAGSLHDIDVEHASGAGREKLRAQLGDIHEGQFVRIKHAQLLLPPYAAVYPQLRYARYYATGSDKPLRSPDPALYAPVSRRSRGAIRAYVHRVGPNPRLPFVIGRLANPTVSFLVPARFRGLGTEPSLLSGNLTVVGKLVYKTALSDPPYQDQTTLDTFTLALHKAPRSLLRKLGIPSTVIRALGRKRKHLLAHIAASLIYQAPVAVVVPIAIYQ
jgi:hypothetical protein